MVPINVALTFANQMVGKRFIGRGVKIGKWVWHHQLLGEILYRRNCLNYFNQIWCVSQKHKLSM